jgi:hypothetical protein
MIIEEVSQLLQTNGIGTEGVDLFLGFAPATVDNCVNLVYSVSPEPHKTFDVYEQTIDFWSRNKSTADGYEVLKDIQALLHRKGNYDLENFHIYFSNSLGSIEDNDVDNEMRKLWKLSIRFIYRPIEVLAS